MLKKSSFSPARSRRAETRLFPSIVLASLRGSTYRSVRLASSLAAALLDGHFEHPAGHSDTITLRSITASRRTKPELFHKLLSMPPSQQFYSGLDDFHCWDAPNQVQCLVTHLVDESSFVGHAGKP